MKNALGRMHKMCKKNYSKQSINHTYLIIFGHVNKHTYPHVQSGEGKQCELHARVHTIKVPCYFNVLMNKEARENSI